MIMAISSDGIDVVIIKCGLSQQSDLRSRSFSRHYL